MFSEFAWEMNHLTNEFNSSPMNSRLYIRKYPFINSEYFLHRKSSPPLISIESESKYQEIYLESIAWNITYRKI